MTPKGLFSLISFVEQLSRAFIHPPADCGLLYYSTGPSAPRYFFRAYSHLSRGLASWHEDPCVEINAWECAECEDICGTHRAGKGCPWAYV